MNNKREFIMKTFKNKRGYSYSKFKSKIYRDGEEDICPLHASKETSGDIFYKIILIDWQKNIMPVIHINLTKGEILDYSSIDESLVRDSIFAAWGLGYLKKTPLMTRDYNNLHLYKYVKYYPKKPIISTHFDYPLEYIEVMLPWIKTNEECNRFIEHLLNNELQRIFNMIIPINYEIRMENNIFERCEADLMNVIEFYKKELNGQLIVTIHKEKYTRIINVQTKDEYKSEEKRKKEEKKNREEAFLPNIRNLDEDQNTTFEEKDELIDWLRIGKDDKQKQQKPLLG